VTLRHPPLARHVLADPYPEFLTRIDSDPGTAWAEFHDFTWRLLIAYPPREFRELPEEVRRDFIAGIVADCGKNDFKALRTYRNQGAPFSAWVATLARNRARSYFRRQAVAARHPDVGHPGPAPRPDDVAAARELLDAVHRAIRRLGNRCQILLRAAAEGHRPADIVLLLQEQGLTGKQVSDALRGCRERLRAILRKGGTELALEGTPGGGE
jgi:hypothetical protein